MFSIPFDCNCPSKRCLNKKSKGSKANKKRQKDQTNTTTFFCIFINMNYDSFVSKSDSFHSFIHPLWPSNFISRSLLFMLSHKSQIISSSFIHCFFWSFPFSLPIFFTFERKLFPVLEYLFFVTAFFWLTILINIFAWHFDNLFLLRSIFFYGWLLGLRRNRLFSFFP